MATNPGVLNADTILYSAMEPEGRKFPAGEQWPGDAWSKNPAGDPVTSGSLSGAQSDLAEANAQIEHLRGRLASQAHDLDVMASERDGANGKLSGLEQRATAAETDRTTAEEATKVYMGERDVARAEVEALKSASAKTMDALAEAQGKTENLAAELETANQTIADLNGKVAELEAAAAPAEKAAKPAKAKPETDAAVEAAQAPDAA